MTEFSIDRFLSLPPYKALGYAESVRASDLSSEQRDALRPIAENDKSLSWEHRILIGRWAAQSGQRWAFEFLLSLAADAPSGGDLGALAELRAMEPLTADERSRLREFAHAHLQPIARSVVDDFLDEE